MNRANPFLVLIFFASATVSYGQNAKPRELTSARGHYKQLSFYSPKPKSSNEAIDNEKFPSDKEMIERRLSLKPIYLQNVRVGDFQNTGSPSQ